MGSYNYGKAQVVAWIIDRFKGGTCLDVGACDGKWADFLGDYLDMDGIEIFEPNVERHNLSEKYSHIFVGDIKDYEYAYYDLVLFGDVIEHMTVENAQKCIEYAKEHSSGVLIAVPYLYTQGAIYGNPWEVHIQNDLTPEVFDRRYPGCKKIWANNEYGYYYAEGCGKC